jgi:hypothetical protein
MPVIQGSNISSVEGLSKMYLGEYLVYGEGSDKYEFPTDELFLRWKADTNVQTSGTDVIAWTASFASSSLTDAQKTLTPTGIINLSNPQSYATQSIKPQYIASSANFNSKPTVDFPISGSSNLTQAKLWTSLTDVTSNSLSGSAYWSIAYIMKPYFTGSNGIEDIYLGSMWAKDTEEVGYSNSLGLVLTDYDGTNRVNSLRAGGFPSGVLSSSIATTTNPQVFVNTYQLGNEADFGEGFINNSANIYDYNNANIPAIPTSQSFWMYTGQSYYVNYNDRNYAMEVAEIVIWKKKLDASEVTLLQNYANEVYNI